MADDFKYDVFLSHSSRDKEVVRPIAERLRSDGLRVWFDQWVLRPGDNIAARTEEGLEHSRVLVFCMSANTFGYDWVTLENQTLRFRDPLNKERRFIPLRLDAAPLKDYLNQFAYIDWLPGHRNREYLKVREACRKPAKTAASNALDARNQTAAKACQLSNNNQTIWTYAFSADGKQALTGDADQKVQLWDVESGKCLRTLKGHTGEVFGLQWITDQRRALSGSADRTVRLWDVGTEQCLKIFEGHTKRVWSTEWSKGGKHALSSSEDGTIRKWDVQTGRCLFVFEGHKQPIKSVKWSLDERLVLSSSTDRTLRLWDSETGRCLRVLEGHTDQARSIAWNMDGRRALSGSYDGTVRLWNVEDGRCLNVLRGHAGIVLCVEWIGERLALTGSDDRTVRVWDVETGRCLRVLQGHATEIRGLMWCAERHLAFSGDRSGNVRAWDVSEVFSQARFPEVSAQATSLPPRQIQYTNAKVLLVGESGAGKTGLSKRLALNDWQPSDSTVGAWATQWKLPAPSGETVEREVWLWDFGGQADQRLIHQLYMDETALAVLVFDGQKEDLFESLGQWDRDLNRASRKAFSKLLVAGRVDAGGLRVSRSQIEAFRRERGYLVFLETSAKTGSRCEELKQAILDGIRWEDIPWRSSPLLFKRLKDEIVRLKDTGRVLLRFNELREALQLRLAGDSVGFTDEELKAVVGLLAGPGVVWELKFGSWVLLQPERINAYAQAVIQTMREDEHERGCLPEERVLNGTLTYQSSMARLEPDEERFVLLAMHQTLVERGLCLRQHTEKGPMLVFPSYYRRERPELAGHPAVLVSYRFQGFLDDIYATLVVRLHHTRPFQQDQLWRYAADFKTLTGKQLGVKLTRQVIGMGELEVYFEPAIPMEEKIIFSEYVHEHLLHNARDVTRLRHYVCPHCGTPVGNREVAMERLEAWLQNRPLEGGKTGKLQSWLGTVVAPTIVCVKCEKRLQLWDEMEQSFANPEIKQRVRELQEQSTLVLDNESKDRALVGDIISTVALAGQISREFNVSDHGIDMEIEFKNDEGHATGRRLYLQLKSGDSYLKKRNRDDLEVFQIKKPLWCTYWQRQAYPVMLVIRSSDGEIRWMDVSDYLRRASNDGKKPVKQVVFEGERFDVMSVRRWRDRELARASLLT